jgi:hypothetical protein
MAATILETDSSGFYNSQWNISQLTTIWFTITPAFNTMGAMPLNDQNSNTARAMHLLDLKELYHFSILKQLKQHYSQR